MRDIRFRAWDRDRRLIVDVLEIDWGLVSDEPVSPEYPKIFCCYTDGHDGPEHYWIYNQDDPILMQYTGLKDKNGKEIYKDDIIKYGNNISVVEWSDRKAAFVVKFKNDRERKSLYWSKYFEIIGNIHQDSHLLK
jgi:uncharacterized phage protein (TIGR01671 family)